MKIITLYLTGAESDPLNFAGTQQLQNVCVLLYSYNSGDDLTTDSVLNSVLGGLDIKIRISSVKY